MHFTLLSQFLGNYIGYMYTGFSLTGVMGPKVIPTRNYGFLLANFSRHLLKWDLWAAKMYGSDIKAWSHIPTKHAAQQPPDNFHIAHRQHINNPVDTWSQ